MYILWKRFGDEAEVGTAANAATPAKAGEGMQEKPGNAGTDPKASKGESV